MIKPKVITVVTLAVVLLVSLVGGIPRAGAAPAIVRSTPESGSTVDVLPETIEMWTSEAVDPALSQIIVVAPNGARIDSGTIEFDDEDSLHLMTALPPAGSGGRYTVHLLTGAPNTSAERSTSFSFEVSGKGECGTDANGSEVPAGCLEALPEVLPDKPAVLSDGSSVAVAMSQTVAGPVDISVTVLDPNGEPAEAARVWVRSAHLEMDHGEFPHEAAMEDDGTFVARYVGMGMEGRWRVAIDVILEPGALPVTVAMPIEMQHP